jgi:hypothetical protein
MNAFRIVYNVLLVAVLATTVTTACGSDNDPTKKAATGGTTSVDAGTPQKDSGASSGGSTSANKDTSTGGRETADSGT